MSDVAVAVTPSDSTDLSAQLRRGSRGPDGVPPDVKPPVRVTAMSGAALHSAVQAAEEEVTSADEQLRVHQTIAALGWGDVLFVDIYTRSRAESLEHLDLALRKNVALFTDQPFERTAVRWRVSS